MPREQQIRQLITIDRWIPAVQSHPTASEVLGYSHQVRRHVLTIPPETCWEQSIRGGPFSV
jgi:hypothetical protein